MVSWYHLKIIREEQDTDYGAAQYVSIGDTTISRILR